MKEEYIGSELKELAARNERYINRKVRVKLAITALRAAKDRLDQLSQDRIATGLVAAVESEIYEELLKAAAHIETVRSLLDLKQ